MNERTQAAFYIACALYINLDSDEVDELLKDHGLSAKTNTLDECRKCVKDRYPDRVQEALRRGRVL